MRSGLTPEQVGQQAAEKENEMATNEVKMKVSAELDDDARAVLAADQELARVAAAPLPHDGFRSRRYVAGCVAFLLIVIGTFGAFVHSGLKPAADRYLDQEYALYLVIANLIFLLIVLGLLSASQVLEVIKLKILGPKAPGK